MNSPYSDAATAQAGRAAWFRRLRLAGGLAALALLAACSGSGPKVSATQEAAQYAARAKHNYAPPGPPGDPWGPYITEASAKYDVPEHWVREVIRQESGGQEYEGDHLIVSPVGAMGLMQVMPSTFDELRARYNLGDDPYDPHDNIMAGTAYLRELYDLYGSPGFLAAYNAGPGRLDDYLTRNRPLPDETRRYVARIGAHLGDEQPLHPSQSAQYALNQIPVNIPPGPRYPRTRSRAPVALADSRSSRYAPAGNRYSRLAVAAHGLPEPPRQTPPPTQYAVASAQRRGGGFHLIGRAVADTLPTHRGGGVTGDWAIQVGAFGNEGQARAAAEAARNRARDMLGGARMVVGTVHQARATLYRARLTGLSHDTALEACGRIAHGHGGCIVLSPDAQS
jgi:soluble lytic murein transglycosylase-like protein